MTASILDWGVNFDPYTHHVNAGAFVALGATVNIAGSLASQNVALGALCPAVRVRNTGTGDAFIQFGTSNAVVATVAASMPIAGGAVEVVGVPAGTTWVAVIFASGAGTVYFTPGAGI